MSERQVAAIGMAVAMIWSVALLWGAAKFVNLPIFALMPTIMTSFMAPGLVVMAMIGRLAARRFFDATVIDGAPFPHGSKGDIDQRVLRNTIEQLVLALCIWPAAAVILAGDGPGVILSLGLGFVVARLAFWGGYHMSPALRAFGFGASFYPTVLVAVWCLLQLATGFR